MSHKQPFDGSPAERDSKRPRTTATLASDTLEKGATLLQTGKWSDFKVKCGQHVFNVHRIVLSGQSQYFDRAIDSDFKEASDGELDLSADEPVIVATILWFMYTKQFRLHHMKSICELVNEPTDPTTTNTYLLLIKIHRCACYLMLDQLSKVVFRKLADLLRHFFGTLGRSKEEKNQHRPLFLNCVHHLFEHESEEKVRDLFAWMMTIMNDKRNKLYLLSDAHLDQLLQSYPMLGAYLYRSMAAQARLDQKCYDCQLVMIREKVDRCLIVDFEDEPRIVRCSCAWRGLCSDLCYTTESKIARAGARCLNCAKGLDIQQAYQRKNLYWEDDQIKLFLDEEPNNTQELDMNETGDAIITLN